MPLGAFFVLLAFAGAFFLIFEIVSVTNNKYVLVLAGLVFGFLLLGILCFEITGEPILKIPPTGNYQVVFVYVGGADVYFGLESQDRNESGKITYYRLPKNVFEGNYFSRNQNPVRLIVGEVGNNETGKIKRLHFGPLAAESGGLTEPNK